jgi:hypothetical protein
MNPTQIGNLIRSGLLALGVSSTVVGYFTTEVYTAIGGVVLAVASGVWMWVSNRTEKLIVAVADEPAVKEVVVPLKLAATIKHPKVVSK